MRSHLDRVVIGVLFAFGFALLLSVVWFRQNSKQLYAREYQMIASPASENCTNKGGTLEIKQRGDDSEYGVCKFENNMQCEEWALFRGECPEGGLPVTGYENEAEVYCAISGGQVIFSQNTSCRLPNKTDCDILDMYYGKCDDKNRTE